MEIIKSKTDRYFTSDLHLGHRFAAEARGYDTIEEHDRDIIDTINATVGRRSTLWILGDVAFDRTALVQIGDILCTKKLFFGNHDKYPLEDYLELFDSIHGFMRYKDLWLSHCPIHPQEMYRCIANVHGHIHKDTATEDIGYPYINVNWDFWRRPVTFEEIMEIVDEHNTDEEKEKTGI